MNASTELAKANIAAQTARINKIIDKEISDSRNKTDTNIAKMGNKVKTLIKQMDNWMQSTKLSQEKKLAIKRFKNELEKVILNSKPQQWYQGTKKVMKDMVNTGENLTPAARKLAKDTQKELNKIGSSAVGPNMPNPVFDTMASLYR
nr:ORF1 [Porcine picobirnavirus]